MYKNLILTAITIATVLHATNVHAKEIIENQPVGKQPTTSYKIGGWVSEQAKDHRDCNYPGWHPEPWYYLDNDGTPEETQYSDYLGDLGWWHEQYPNACQIEPEPFTK